MLPVQVTMRDLPNSPVLEDHIRKKAQKLEKLYQKITRCRVIITLPQKHKHQGKLYSVHIEISVPGKEIAVSRHKDEDIYVATRDAFHAVARQLENYIRKKKGHVKTHQNGKQGSIVRLYSDEYYGFIEDNDGNEYYFSNANVAFPSFIKLRVGDTVSFIGVPANDGLQANHITRGRNHYEEAG